MKKLFTTLLFLFVIAILSLSAQTRIYPPTLVSPANGGTNQMPDVVLDWSAVGGSGGVVTYDLQIDTDAGFPNPASYSDLEFSGMQMSDLLFAQEYFWRVRSKEGADMSDWSETFSFSIFEKVDLSKPNSAATDQNPNVELKCKDRIGSALITGVDNYVFEADTSANFDSPLLWEGTSSTISMNTSYLHFGETYTWRAKATHPADESAWSDTRTFTVVAAVELDKPENNSVDMGLENDLTWDAIPGVIDYTVQISDDDIFSDPQEMIVEDPKYTTNGYLTFGKEYFWRVRANHAKDTSDWSEVFSFTTSATVHLNTPANNAQDVSINPLLKWDMITGVDNFQVQYNPTPDFEEPCCDKMVEPEDNFFQVIYILQYETSYYWRARAMQGADTTVWSEVWHFTTRPIDFGIHETFNADNINIFPNPTSGKLNIDIASDATSDVNIFVMDLLGQIHVEETMVFGKSNTNKSIDLSNLANGLYIVKLVRDGQSYSHKITIHK